MPSAISAREAAPLARRPARARDDARDEHRPERERGGVGRERQRHPDGEQEGADGRRDELVGEQERALHAGVGDAEVLAGTRPGIRVLLAESANVSAVPSTNSATRTTAMFTVPSRSSPRGPRGRPRRAGSTTTTIRRRSKRSAAAPPITPNSRTGRYSLSSAIETRNGSWSARRRAAGPAARTTPSPALLTTAAARSQRKLRPSRVGTMASAGRAITERTARTIATGPRPGRASERRFGVVGAAVLDRGVGLQDDVEHVTGVLRGQDGSLLPEQACDEVAPPVSTTPTSSRGAATSRAHPSVAASLSSSV